MTIAVWNIGDGKEHIKQTIPFPSPGTFACATNERGRFFCTHGDFYSVIKDVRMSKQLENMEWKLINFGIDNGFPETIPLRRVQQPLMSQSGDWVLVREKQVKFDEKRKKQKRQYVESYPTMLYLGLCNVPLTQWSTGVRKLAMRLYALQRASEQGVPATMPPNLQKAIIPPQKQDDCTIA